MTAVTPQILDNAHKILHREERHAEALLATLERERTALLAGDIQGLARTAMDKERLVADIQALDRALAELLHEAGATDLAALIAAAGEGQGAPLAAARQRLRRSRRAIQDSNLANQRLVVAAQEFLAEAVATLCGPADQAGYGKGSRRPPPRTATFISREV